MSIRVVSAFLCEKAGVEPSGKVWAQGIGPLIYSASQYPIPKFEVFIVLLVEADASEIGSNHQLELEIQNADGKKIMSSPSNFPVTAENRRFANHRQMGFTIVKPGLMQFVVKLDGKNTGFILPLEFLKS